MNEIARMERYIENTKLNINNRYFMSTPEAIALAESIRATGDILDAIVLAFEYGMAKGCRATKAQVRR